MTRIQIATIVKGVDIATVVDIVAAVDMVVVADIAVADIAVVDIADMTVEIGVVSHPHVDMKIKGIGTVIVEKDVIGIPIAAVIESVVAAIIINKKKIDFLFFASIILD
jgi:hypothetical protein